jgi:opacity protein-like surface antigen
VSGTSLIVIAIALEARNPVLIAFEDAARGVLGRGATVQIDTAESDPPDAEVAALGAKSDGVVELTLSEDGARARLHCFLSGQKRWVDREIVFPAEGAPSESEVTQRGRLLGFAAASMFTGEADEPEVPVVELNPPAPMDRVAPSTTKHASPPYSETMSLELAGAASTGLGGTASGWGASVGLRWAFAGPLGARMFFAGRAGSVPEAQSTTRTLQGGAGLSLRLLPATSRLLVGARLDAILSYFETVHFSEDDAEPDRKSRFLPGVDLLAEAGFRLSQPVSLYGGAGIEAMFGSTTIDTHGQPVAVIPPFRVVGELGLRVFF